MGRSQAVRQQTLTLSYVGSIPTVPKGKDVCVGVLRLAAFERVTWRWDKHLCNRWT